MTERIATLGLSAEWDELALTGSVAVGAPLTRSESWRVLTALLHALDRLGSNYYLVENRERMFTRDTANGAFKAGQGALLWRMQFADRPSQQIFVESAKLVVGARNEAIEGTSGDALS